MDEAANVLERLERIRELDRRRVPTSRLLEELRELVGEAERWSKAEGDARARAAAVELAGRVTKVEEEVRPTRTPL